MKLTADGIYRLDEDVTNVNSDQLVIYISGLKGTATLSLGYLNENNDFVVLNGGSNTNCPTEFVATTGYGMSLQIRVAGVTVGTAVYVSVRGVQNA